MKQVCDFNICTGCATCADRCPKQCISMQPGNGLGHLYPVIDQESCIDCGACQDVCPALHENRKRHPIKAYAGWDKNEEEYESSTSGGAASAFSRYILREGGVVYGCAMLPGVEVRHIRVDREDDIHRLKGSKYVQSDMKGCYRSLKSDLKAGKKVLFIGTPCQVAGVKSFLKNDDTRNLYTVDLICHGVPSLSFLQKHIKKVTCGKTPDEVYFRKGGGYCLLLLLQGKELYRSSFFEERYKDIYYNTFFDGFSYRESCYRCKYAANERISDVTIGDFWGLRGNLPVPHPNGCSVILPVTDKGIGLVNAITPEFYLFGRPVEEAVSGNEQLRNPKHKDWRIRLFHRLYPILGIGFSYRICQLDKIGRRFVRNIVKNGYEKVRRCHVS